MLDKMHATVAAVSLSPKHTFSKAVAREIVLLAGLGVQGDAHAGVTVRHRYRVRKDPNAPNLCQVHLIHEELFAELAEQEIAVAPGEMGENVATRGLDVLALPRGTRLHLGPDAIVEVTGLRDPCNLMNELRPGLMKACLARAADGTLVRKAGIMGIVIQGGVVRAGDAIEVRLPAGEPLPLYPV
jgi:MOSC domain-containing protein YiiM